MPPSLDEHGWQRERRDLDAILGRIAHRIGADEMFGGEADIEPRTRLVEGNPEGPRRKICEQLLRRNPRRAAALSIRIGLPGNGDVVAERIGVEEIMGAVDRRGEGCAEHGDKMVASPRGEPTHP